MEQLFYALNTLYWGEYGWFTEYIECWQDKVTLEFLFDICNEQGNNEAKVIIIKRLNELTAPIEERLEL